MLEIPIFETKKELFDFIVKNEEQLLNQKKSIFKKADGIGIDYVIAEKNNVAKANKSNTSDLLNKDTLDVIAVINTTNIMDSHKDVHIPGLWDKSLSENKRILHVQEHKAHEFKSIIASGNDLKAYVKTKTWKELGFNAEGNTQALIFESKVRKSRNEYMHSEYAKGHVDNHSVGMRYVKIVTCINDDDYGAQKEAWDKYYPQIANKEDAENIGYFWAITEAKVVEGSAVPAGSNPITPTTSVKSEPQYSAKELAARKFLNLD